MPNGYRRGGTYTRNGRTYSRRGTSIKPGIRRPATVLAVSLISITAATGGSLVGSPVLIAGVSLAVVGWLVFRTSKTSTGKRITKRLTRYAASRYKKRTHRPELLARVPAKGARSR